jgi:hypothetical protein
MSKRRFFIGLIIVLIGLIVPVTLAQTTSLTWSTIDGGGGTSQDSRFSLVGSIGQWDASEEARDSAGRYQVAGGFWGAVAITSNISNTITKTITPNNGGSLSNNTGTVNLSIPPGAVNTPTEFVYTEQKVSSHPLPANTVLVGPTFVLTVYQNGIAQPNFSLNQPLTMTITYNENALNGDEKNLTLYAWNGTQWITTGLTILNHDTANNQLVIQVTEIQAEYALLLPAQQTIACDVPLQSVAIFGPMQGLTNKAYVFTALISPTKTSPPISYTWSPEPQAGQGTSVATYTFATVDSYGLNLTVSHCDNASVSQQALHQINITQPPKSDSGDIYETDNRCVDATLITVNNAPQFHTFHAPDNPDWASFSAVAGETYIVEARVPPTSTADIALELYDTCDGTTTGKQNPNFSSDVRLIFKATTDGDIFMRFSNSDNAIYGSQASYYLSVRDQTIPANGALVLVAGKIKENDPVQSNIHAVTDAVYQLATASGCSDDDIFYLAHDANLPGVDSPATVDNLQTAINQASTRVGPDKRFTLFLADHGNRNKFYLNGRDEFITATELDATLSNLEANVPQVKVSLIMEACYSGSFLQTEQGLNRNDRLFITSTGAESLAYATATGAVFADTFLAALSQGDSLQIAFQEANWTASQANPDQTPWLDANNNGIPNEAEDEQLATQRGFACAAVPSTVEQWPPTISQIQIKLLNDGNLGLWAEVVDDKPAITVWAEVYPPSYTPVEESETLVQSGVPALPMITTTAPNIYSSFYPANSATEAGEYRVVFYARDDDGNLAHPKYARFNTRKSDSVYLPVLLRHEIP